MKTTTNRKSRPHHRTTLLTTTKKTYSIVRALKVGNDAEVEFPNDIISSACGGSENQHHSIRRVSLLRRQIAAGYRTVKVRWEKGIEIPCIIIGNVRGAVDGCTGTVRVQKA